LFRDELKHRRPDVVILWGSLLLEMTVMREAREAGVPVVFYLVNSGYKNKEAFRYASVVVTDTQATADLYQERFGMSCKPIGKFIDVGLIKAQVRKPEFITFINPSFEKGVNVFMPLAKLAARECPEIRFLVVESRGRWSTAMKVLKFQPGDFPNVKVIGHQRDMRPVYGNARALLLPSTWFESGARVIPEALLNGVPILASDTGGSSELVGQGGVIFTLPEDVREKKGVAAGEEVVRPWLDEIKRIWHDEAHYADLCGRAAKEGENHDIQNSTRRFLNAVAPFVAGSKGIAPKAVAATEGKSILSQALAKKQEKLAKRNRRPR
jgi:glycosyltransferase involved in cell wall biosynthesis